MADSLNSMGWGGDDVYRSRGGSEDCRPDAEKVDFVKVQVPVQVQAPVFPLREYESPNVVTLESLDLEQLYKNSIDPNHPEAFESDDALEVIVRDFFERLKIPVTMQVPITSVYRFGNKGLVVMKGLLFSPAMREAFAKFDPDVQICKPIRNQLLDEVHVDLDFFEKIVLGEAMATRVRVHAAAQAVTAEA